MSFDLGPAQLWPKVVCRLRFRAGPLVYKRGIGRLTLPTGWGDVRLCLHGAEPGVLWSGQWGWIDLRIRRRASCPS